MIIIVIFFVTVTCLEHKYSEFTPTLPKCPNFEPKVNNCFVEIPPMLLTGKKSTFCLVERRPDCVLNELTISLENSTEENSLSIEPNGVLKLDLEYYWPHEFCLESLNAKEIVINTCQISCPNPDGKICVPKCCVWGEVLSFEEARCVSKTDGEQIWKPTIHHQLEKADVLRCVDWNDQSKNCIHHNMDDERFHFQNSFEGCEEEFDTDMISFEKTPFAFTDDGNLYAGEYIFRQKNFCIDELKTPQGMKSHGAVACQPRCNETDEYLQQRVNIAKAYVGVMFISAFFLLITIIVYILTWDQQNIHGWTVFSLSISMGLLFVLLSTSRLIALNLRKNQISGAGICVTIALLTHFCFLSTFSLLTCLSFDLWWTFRSLSASVGKSKGVLRFRFYLGFALGFPLMIVCIGLILDQVYGGMEKSARTRARIIIPEYGVDTCYIADKHAIGLFVYLPMASLMLANLLFFLRTMWIMYKYHQNTREARKNLGKQKETMHVFIKLFIVMGVTWTVEVIEYLSVYSRPEKDKNLCPIYYSPGYSWMITDFFNTFQGIAIFVIFVCKKAVMIRLSRKNIILKGIVSPVFLLPCCKLTEMDLEDRSSCRTHPSNVSVSMRAFTQPSRSHEGSDVE